MHDFMTLIPMRVVFVKIDAIKIYHTKNIIISKIVPIKFHEPLMQGLVCSGACQNAIFFLIVLFYA